MKNLFYLSFIFFLLCSCSSPQPNREEIVIWASHIANIENKLDAQFTRIYPTIVSVSKNSATIDEIMSISTFALNARLYYNQIKEVDEVIVDMPQEAKSLQIKFVRYYKQINDFASLYDSAISLKNMDYFERSVLALQEATRLGDEAHNDFINLLDEYSISCKEIDDCENPYLD